MWQVIKGRRLPQSESPLEIIREHVNFVDEDGVYWCVLWAAVSLPSEQVVGLGCGSVHAGMALTQCACLGSPQPRFPPASFWMKKEGGGCLCIILETH